MQKQHALVAANDQEAGVVAPDQTNEVPGVRSWPGQTPRKDEALRELLLLVHRDVSLDELATWSDDDYRKVEGWAGAVYLVASDNRIAVPPLPTVLGGHHAEDDEYGLVEDEHGDEEMFIADEDDAPDDPVEVEP